LVVSADRWHSHLADPLRSVLSTGHKRHMSFYRCRSAAVNKRHVSFYEKRKDFSEAALAHPSGQNRVPFVLC
jgi:hypothetical protein